MVETLDRWLAETSKSRQVVMVKQVVRPSSGGVKHGKIGKITNTSFYIGYPHIILFASSGKLVSDYVVFSSVVYVNNCISQSLVVQCSIAFEEPCQTCDR